MCYHSGAGAVKEAVLGAAIVKVVGKDELLEMAFQVEKTVWTEVGR